MAPIIRNSIQGLAVVLLAGGMLLTLSGQAADTGAAGAGATKVETEIPVASMPQAVTAALKAQYPAAEIKEAESVTKNGQTYYEVNLMLADGKLEAKVSPEGKILEVEKEGKDDDKEGEHDEKK